MAIVGSLSSNIKSQLGALVLSQSSWTRKWSGMQAYCKENIDVIEKLLSLCCSLQQLKMEGLMLTSNMAASICKNGKTLQVLNLSCRSELLYYCDTMLHRLY